MRSGFAIAAAIAVLMSGGAVSHAASPTPDALRDAIDGDAAMRQALGLQIGAYLDRRLGRDLSADDQARHDAAAADALWNHSKGYGASWRNGDSGASGAIEPSSKVEMQGDAVCRHFHDTVRLPGRPLFGVDGTVCLNGHDWTVDY